VFVALVHVGNEGEGLAIGGPGDVFDIDAEGGKLPRFPALAREEEEFLSRGGFGIGQVAATIEAEVHPVIGAAFEALLGEALEFRLVIGWFGGLASFGKGDPLVVGAEDGDGFEAGDLEGLSVEIGRVQEPGLATGGEGEEFAVRRPLGI
jgi:hypothetical protein